MNIEEMRRVAVAATPSPWAAGSNNHQKPLSEWSIDRFDPAESDDDKNPVISDSIRREADARFIAAFNPAVVLGLLRVVEAAEALDGGLLDMGDSYMCPAALAEALCEAIVGMGRGGAK